MMNFPIPYELTNPVIKLNLKLESMPETFAISPTFPLVKTSYLDCGKYAWGRNLLLDVRFPQCWPCNNLVTAIVVQHSQLKWLPEKTHFQDANVLARVVSLWINTNIKQRSFINPYICTYTCSYDFRGVLLCDTRRLVVFRYSICFNLTQNYHWSTFTDTNDYKLLRLSFNLCCRDKVHSKRVEKMCFRWRKMLCFEMHPCIVIRRTM